MLSCHSDFDGYGLFEQSETEEAAASSVFVLIRGENKSFEKSLFTT